MYGFNARCRRGEVPTKKPSGTATSIASAKPTNTRPIEKASWIPIPLSLVPPFRKGLLRWSHPVRASCTGVGSPDFSEPIIA